MDIVTHGMMGAVFAAPVFEQHPLAACGLALGSALPDLDVLSRVFGKRAFLRSHQTLSHSIPVILLVGAVAGLVASFAGLGGFGIATGLALGMLLHTLLDVCNTYGITLLAPFSRRRVCVEWVFFIDAYVLAATVVAFSAVAIRFMRDGRVGVLIPTVYAGFLVAYLLLRGLLRQRAGRLAPSGTLSLMPSALVPGIHLGCLRSGSDITTFRLNSITGRTSNEQRIPVLDAEWRDALAAVPEVSVMRELTPAYHVVRACPEGGGTKLLLRDLRTRNFSTTFGNLEFRVTADGRIDRKEFHV